MHGLLVFVTPTLKTGTADGTAYKYDPPPNNALFSHTNESVALQHKDLYVEIQGRRYK